MSISNRRVVRCLLVVAAVIGIARPMQSQERGPARPEIRGIVKAIDVGGGSITVSFFEGRQATAPTEKSYPISKNVEVVIGNSIGRSGGSRCTDSAGSGPHGGDSSSCRRWRNC